MRRIQSFVGAVGRTLAIGLLLATGLDAAKAGDAPLPVQAGTAAPAEIDQASPLRFFAVGDLPYSRSEIGPLRALLSAAADQHPPFIVHVGDIKSGSSPCTDDNLREIAGMFHALPMPVAYTPGDNEWTDCHRASAGGLDPRERLARVRGVFYGDPTVLRLGDLGAVHAAAGYPEDYRFQLGKVMFIALHIVGSNNGLDENDPAAQAEFQAREAANQAFLDQSLQVAKAQDARALVLLMQADPMFDRGRGPSGFRGFKDQLIALMDSFPGAVLVLHGDSHRFRQDRPLLDPRRGSPFERLVRVEVPGSPVVGGVWITVDPEAPEPFAAQPVYAVSLDSMKAE